MSEVNQNWLEHLRYEYGWGTIFFGVTVTIDGKEEVLGVDASGSRLMIEMPPSISALITSRDPRLFDVMSELLAQVEIGELEFLEDRWREEEARKREPIPAPVRDGHVYLIRAADSGQFKIGRTKKLGQRMANLSSSLPFKVELVHSIECADSYRLEKYFHGLFAAKRINGEWFALGDEEVRLFMEYRPDAA